MIQCNGAQLNIYIDDIWVGQRPSPSRIASVMLQCHDTNHTSAYMDDVLVITSTSAFSVPTMNQWGMVMMSVLLGGIGIYLLSRRQVWEKIE